MKIKEEINKECYGENDEKLKSFFGLFGEKYSLYQTAMKLERGLSKKFKLEKERLLEKNKKCILCGKSFSKKGVHLHHKKEGVHEAIKKRNSIIEKIKIGSISPKEAYDSVKDINDEIYKDYINFKDVILICNECHFQEHKKFLCKNNII